MTNKKRKEAMLTDTQRDFLRGEKRYEGENAKQQRYQMRERISRRVRDTLLDFALLYETVDEHERDRIFNVGGGVTDREATRDFHSTLVDTLAFIYLSLEGEIESDTHRHRAFGIPFDTVLEQAVKRGEAARYNRDVHNSRITVEFDVELKVGHDLLSAERAIEKIAELKFSELTEKEMFDLLYLYDPLVTPGPYDDSGYKTLDERVLDKRDELDIGPPLDEEMSEEEWERAREESAVGDSKNEE